MSRRTTTPDPMRSMLFALFVILCACLVLAVAALCLLPDALNP